MSSKKTNLEFACKIEQPSFVREDDRGLFVEIVNGGPWETIIHGSMNKGSDLGNHYHRECRALFYLVDGLAEVRTRFILTGDKIVTNELKAREMVLFRPFETHIVHFLADSDFILLKSYRYEDDQPDIFPLEV